MDVHCSFSLLFFFWLPWKSPLGNGQLYLFRLYGFSIKVQGSGFKVSSYRRYLLWRSQKEINLLKAERRGESKTLAQRLQTSDFSQSPYLHKKRARRLFFYFRFLHTCHAERTKQSVTMPAVTNVMASSWLCVRQRANAVRIARKRSLMVFVIGSSKE